MAAACISIIEIPSNGECTKKTQIFSHTISINKRT